MSAVLEAESTVIESTPQESTADSVQSETGSRKKTLWKYLGSLFDQSLVSGSRFAISILIGAVCGAAELGLYAIGFSILMALHAIQLSLICRPYTICGNQMDESERRQLAGSVLVQFLGFGLLAGLGLAVAAVLLSWLDSSSSLTSILLILAAGAPPMLLREHARQYCFAQLKVNTVTLIDVIGTIVLFVGLGWLVWADRLSAVTALAASAVAAAITGAVWLRSVRHDLDIRFGRILIDLASQWRIGKWDCASEMAFALQIYGTTWLLAALLDTTRVGIYAACMMSIQVLNPFLLGVNSLLVPKTARAWAEDGAVGLQRFVSQTTVILGTLTAAFAIVTAIWGPGTLEWLYRGQGFEIPAVVVALLLLGVVTEVIGIGPENAVWAMSRHDLNFRVHLTGCLVTCLAAWPLITSFGLTGAAASFALGRLATTAAQWIAYRCAADRQPAVG